MNELDQQLEGRTAIVTGATSGLGRHFSELLAAQGCRVALIGRRQNRLAEVQANITRSGGDCLSVALDLEDPVAIARKPSCA